MSESTAVVKTTDSAAAPAARPINPLFAGWAPEDVDLIRRTIAPDASEHELALYLRLCRTYGLDPFRRELVLEKRRRRRADGTGYDVVPVFITTRDGYLKAAMRDPGYAGITSGVVCEGDIFEFDVEHLKIVHRFGAKRGKILGAWAVAYHTERPPMMAYVPFDEYTDPNSDTWRRHPSAMIQKVAEVYVLRRWRRHPSAMIQKVAEVYVLRRQYSISGIVAREEMERDLAEDGTRRARRTGVLPPRPATSLPAPAANGSPQTVPGAAVGQPAASARPRPTEFWRAVRAAAAVQRSDPMEWLRTRTNGETDLRKLSEATVTAVFEEARRAANGEAREIMPGKQAEPVQPTALPSGEEPHPAPASETGAADRPAAEPENAPTAAGSHRDRIARIQAIWKQRGVSLKAQAAMVQAVSRVRTAMLGELTADELDAVLVALEQP